MRWFMKGPMRWFAHIFTAVAVTALLSTAVAAETALGTYGDWEAYQRTEKGKRVCYIGSEPTTTRGKYKVRGRTFILVTHRPAEKSRNVVSFRAGYTFKKGYDVSFVIAKTSHMLSGDGDWAFTPDQDADDALVKAMIRGNAMTVKATSSRNTKTTDTYSLKGFTAAYRAIGRACKI
jgi:invasion protein IalB